MNTLIDRHREAITALCAQYGVRRLDVFGSVLGDDFDPERSDVDFLVEFEDPSYVGRADRYFGLQFALERLLGRRVDLVMNTALKNPYLRKHIEQSRMPVHAAA